MLTTNRLKHMRVLKLANHKAGAAGASKDTVGRAHLIDCRLSVRIIWAAFIAGAHHLRLGTKILQAMPHKVSDFFRHQRRIGLKTCRSIQDSYLDWLR